MPMTNNRGQSLAPLGAYMEELRHLPFFSPKEERRLALALSKGRRAQRRVHAGDVGDSLPRLVEEGRKAEEALAQALLPLVISMARQMLSQNTNVGLSLDDLVLAGNEGVLEALRRYKPSRGYRLKTYAVWWVRNKISREIRLYRWMISIPDHAYRELLRIMRVYGQLSQELSRDPSEEEAAARLGMSARRVRALVSCWGVGDVLSLDRDVAQDGPTTFGDLVGDSTDPAAGAADHSEVAEEAESDALREAIDAVMATLTPREQKVVTLRFGLEDGESRTLAGVGRQLRVSSERVRQIQVKAMRKLRHPSRSKKLREFLQ